MRVQSPLRLQISRQPWLPRVLPFAAYALVLAAESLTSGPDAQPSPWLYGLRAGSAGLALLLLAPFYDELKQRPGTRGLALAATAGIAVFVAWIGLSQPWAILGEPAGWRPMRPGVPEVDWTLAAMRFAGAVVVVPVMEELFWRSFIMRWLDDSAFSRIAPARVSRRAFWITAVLFGLEHFQWLAGIAAGAAYGWLYTRSGNLWLPIAAHAVTNGVLGAWVLANGRWDLW